MTFVVADKQERSIVRMALRAYIRQLEKSLRQSEEKGFVPRPGSRGDTNRHDVHIARNMLARMEKENRDEARREVV